jgi:hypothetical protein
VLDTFIFADIIAGVQNTEGTEIMTGIEMTEVRYLELILTCARILK